MVYCFKVDDFPFNITISTEILVDFPISKRSLTIFAVSPLSLAMCRVAKKYARVRTTRRVAIAER